MNTDAIIKKLNNIYGLKPRKSQSAIKEDAETLQYDIRSPKGELILSYLIETKNCPNGLPFIVPIRNGLSTLKLTSAITADTKDKKPSRFSWRQRKLKHLVTIKEKGLTIKANPSLKAKGVIADCCPGKTTGRIKSSTTLIFKKEWMLKSKPKVGREVSFLPLIEVGKSLQARAIEPI